MNILHPESTRILSFKFLENGWYLGTGVAVVENVIQKAISIIEQTRDIWEDIESFPQPDGSLNIIFYSSKKFEFDVWIMPDNNIFRVKYNDERNLPIIMNVPYDTAVEYLFAGNQVHEI